MEDDHVDEVMYLAAACNRWRHSQDPRGDDEITRLAAACDRRRRRSQVPRDVIDRWSSLPRDVLSQIICRLPARNDRMRLRHRLRFAAVCRHWRAVERLHLPYSLPKLCLALPDGSFYTFQPGSSFVLKPRDNVSRGNYRGATMSQLLCDTEDSNAYSLVNPFTLRKRQLPVPSDIRVVQEEDQPPAPDQEEGYCSEEMPVRKLVVCPNSGGLVAAIVGHERCARIALCNPESVWWWVLSAHNDPWQWYADMVFFDGKLYALTNNEDLLALEIGHDDDDDDDESGTPRISRVERVIDGAGCGYILKEYTRMRYLVVRPRGRGLLMVCRIMLEYGATTCEFAVFQADLRSSKWVQTDTLGDDDEALFVGRLCSRAVIADHHGVGNNLIFFLNDFAGMERRPGLILERDALAIVYDMKDGSVREILPIALQPHGSSTGSWNRAVPATWLFTEDIDIDD